MNWRDLKPGDRVRVTFEAPVSFVCKSSICLALDPTEDEEETSFTYTEANAATWELLEPTLRVGRAKFKHTGTGCQVLAINENAAWIKHDRGGYDTFMTEYLENIDEEPSHD